MAGDEPRPAGGNGTPGKATYYDETVAWNPLLGRQAAFMSACSTHACGSPPHLSTPPPLYLPHSPHPPPSAWHFPAVGGASRSGGGGQGRLVERSQHRNITASQGVVSSPSLPQSQSNSVTAPYHLHFFLRGGGTRRGKRGNSRARLSGMMGVRRLKCSQSKTDVP